MKKKLFYLLAVVLLSFQVLALDFEEKHTSNVIVKEFDNPVTLNIKITDAKPGIYNFYTLSDISLTPNELFNISKAGNVEKTLTLTPTKNLKTDGLYTFTYTLNYRGVEKIDKKFSVKLINLEDILEISSDSVDEETGKIIFHVKNKENVELKNVKVKFSSILFETEAEFDIKPLQEEKFSVVIDKELIKKTKAGAYVITAEFETPKGETKVEGILILGEKKGLMTYEETSGFLIRTTTIKKINAGNVLENIEIKVSKNIISRLFTSFSVDPSLVNRAGLKVEYVWLKERLQPTETYSVEVKTNYLLPTLIILFVIIALIGYKRYSETKIEVRKSVHPVRTKNDEFALKIKLSVKAKKSIENVALVDKIPAIVKLYNKFSTISPDKIDAEHRRLHWNLGNLKAGEERVLTYILYSKVGVVGKFSLPEALAVFEYGGQIQEAESKKVFFLNDQIKG